MIKVVKILVGVYMAVSLGFIIHFGIITANTEWRVYDLQNELKNVKSTIYSAEEAIGEIADKASDEIDIPQYDKVLNDILYELEQTKQLAEENNAKLYGY